MAKKKKKCTKRNSKGLFEKGNKASVGNGRPKMTPEQKQVAMMTRTRFKTILNQFMDLTLAEIKKELKNENRTILELSVLKHLKAMHENGSMDRVDWSLDHIAGPRPKKSEVKVSGEMQQTNKLDLSKLSPEELLALKKMVEKGESK